MGQLKQKHIRTAFRFLALFLIFPALAKANVYFDDAYTNTLRSRTANPASTGFGRMAVADAFGWRNNANSGNLMFGIDGSDNLQFNSIKVLLSGAVVNADINAAAGIVDTKLATISTAGKVSNSATTATSASTNSAIVARDGSGNFSAGTITASLTGNASTATALAANPTDCSTNNYATAIDAGGNLTCGLVSAASGLTGIAPVANGGTGQNTLTNHGVLVGATTTGITQLSAAAAGTLLSGQGSSADPSFTATPTLGSSGTLGSLALAGNTSGAVTIKPQAAAGTFNFNLPITAGNTGDVLTSAGGGSSAMTWTSTLPVANGGTGQTTSYTDGQLLIGNSSNSSLSKATLTAGSNITITNGNGSISIAASSAAAAAWNYTSQTTTYSAVINDFAVLSGASFTVTLPTAASQSGKSIVLVHAGTSGSQVYTINTTSAQTVGGLASGVYVMRSNGDQLWVMSDGANWQIVEANARVIVRATNTSGQAIANASNTVVTNWTSVIDTSGSFVASTGIFTLPSAGNYLVIGQLSSALVATSAGTFFGSRVFLNGALYATGFENYSSAQGSPSWTCPFYTVVQGAKGDTITIAAFQNSTASRNLSSTAGATYLSIVRLGN